MTNYWVRILLLNLFKIIYNFNPTDITYLLNANPLFHGKIKYRFIIAVKFIGYLLLVKISPKFCPITIGSGDQ